MSVIYQIPHTARFLSPAAGFIAPFNTVEIGKYSFNSTINKTVPVLKMEPNTIYLIERISWGASIPSEIYSGRMDGAPPRLALKTKIAQDLIFAIPYSLANYTNDSPFVAWYKNDLADDEIQAEVTGTLKQSSELVGINSITLSASFAIYAINDARFSEQFRGVLSSNVGEQVRGGL